MTKISRNVVSKRKPEYKENACHFDARLMTKRFFWKETIAHIKVFASAVLFEILVLFLGNYV